jgi:acetoin utilization deacetylase AcuC-like enzyme
VRAADHEGRDDGRVKVVYTLRHRHHHPEYELSVTGFNAPLEHPDRAEIIRAALAARDGFELVAPDEWGREPIDAVHDPGLAAFLEVAWEEYQQAHGYHHDVVPDVFDLPALREGMGAGPEPREIRMRLGQWCYETTTPLTYGTYDAARSSVDVALTAGRLVADGEPVAYGLCRPPGHHAARAAYGGYCFFNNAAIVAHHLATTRDAKVTVLDVDYHHGNGTQQIFYDRPDVQFVSLHGDPAHAYPYVTGFRDERGTGAGLGTVANFPLPAETDDAEYLGALSAACADISAFAPDLVIVSLGVDTYWEDPICDFELTTDGLGGAAAMVRELGLPVIVLQEGGYAASELGTNVVAWLEGVRPLVADEPGPEKGS